MALVLVVVGVALVALGTLVLLRFPDRPGGRVRMLGMEVSSVGAGLPVIALGVLAIVTAGIRQSDRDSTTTSASSGGGGGGSVARAPPADAPACLKRYFEREPAVAEGRRRTLPAEAQDVDVLGEAEPKLREFGLVLTNVGEVVGAMKLGYDTDATQFRIAGAVDARCRAITWTATDPPGPNPPLVNNFNHLNLTLGGTPYEIELKADVAVEMELHRSPR